MPFEAVTMDLARLFADYLRYGRYLKGWSPETVVICQRSFTSFQKSLRGGDSNSTSDESLRFTLQKLDGTR
jgi:hypothetical protein